MTSAFPNRFTGTGCKTASSFPPQRPAEVRVQVEEPSFGSIVARGQKNQSRWLGISSPRASVFMSDTERKYETPNVPVCTARCQVFSSAGQFTSRCRGRHEHREKRGAAAQRFARAGGSRSPPPAGTRETFRAANAAGRSGMVAERSIQRTIRAKSAIRAAIGLWAAA